MMAWLTADYIKCIMASFQAPASAGARLDAARHAITLVINQEIAWRAHYIHTMLRNNESESPYDSHLQDNIYISIGSCTM